MSHIRMVKTVLISIIIPGTFLSLGGWSLSQASKNSQDITAIKAEYRLIMLSLKQIESGIIILNTKQEVLNKELATMNTAQALTNQSIVDHIKIDSARAEAFKSRIDRHVFDKTLHGR